MKNGGLGSMPKGLEWINKNNQIPVKNQQTEQTVPAQTITTPQPIIPNQNLFQPSIEKPQPIKLKTPQKKSSISSSTGLPEGYTRATFIIKQNHIDRLKALSYVNKASIKDLVDQAMTKFLKDKDVSTILMEAVNGVPENSENKV